MMERTEHVQFECRCGRTGCAFCDGGLFACTVCEGLEGSVPTDCPGRAMTEAESDGVHRGEIDYRAELGGWVTRSNREWPHSILKEYHGAPGAER